MEKQINPFDNINTTILASEWASKAKSKYEIYVFL